MLTTALMLDQLGYPQDAARVEAAVRDTIRAGNTTPDLGGTLGTEAVGSKVCELLGRLATA